MLEHSSLHIAAWTRTTLANSAPAWVRPINDAAANPVGFLRFEGKARSYWFSWLRSVRLQVYETEDASHVMSLVRSWSMLQIWDVYDAEEHRVGRIHPPSLIDSEGERRGYLHLPRRDQGDILDPASRVLATFRKITPADLEVVFTPASTANPFLRMLLLGSILIQEPLPK